VSGVAEAVRSAGGRAGARVAVLMHTSAPLVAALHAVPRAGCVLVPLNARLTAVEVGAALSALGVTLVVVGQETAALARAALAGSGLDVPVLEVALPSGPEGAPGAVGADAAHGAAATGAAFPAEEPGGASEWAVLWTSGTTGQPRGVALTRGNFAASADASRARLGLGPDDRWLLALSAAHIGGLALVLRAAFLGSTLVTRGAFSPAGFDRLIDAGRVTHVSLVPTMLLRAVEQRAGRPPPPSLRCVLVGGARTPPELVERALAAGFPLALTYGMTEACSQIATAPPELVRSDPRTVGAPMPGVELRIDPAGEILVRGAVVASTYVGTSEPLTDGEGWLHTGDLGQLDAQGHLRITGRRTDRILTGGMNVDPAEVEDVLRQHECVEDVAVVGIPDAEWGERVCAAVVAIGGGEPSAESVELLARERLTGAKIPRRIVFVEALPRNENGKVDRAAVRGLIQAAGEPHP